MKTRSIILAWFLLWGVSCAASDKKPTIPTNKDIQEITISRFTVSPLDDYFKNFSVGSSDVQQILQTYHQVSKEQWFHQYQHVAGAERTGCILLKSGQWIKWMVKPGGLAILTYSNSQTIYLAKG